MNKEVVVSSQEKDEYITFEFLESNFYICFLFIQSVCFRNREELIYSQLKRDLQKL